MLAPVPEVAANYKGSRLRIKVIKGDPKDDRKKF